MTPKEYQQEGNKIKKEVRTKKINDIKKKIETKIQIYYPDFLDYFTYNHYFLSKKLHHKKNQ